MNHTILLCFLASAACDNNNDVEFRSDPPEVLYLPQTTGKIGLGEFANKVVLACLGVQKVNIAVTFYEYPPDESDGPRLISLGFAVVASEELADCYKNVLVDIGAAPYP